MQIYATIKSNHNQEIKKLQRALKAAQKRAMRKVLKPLRSKIRADAPRVSGRLKKSIITKVDHGKKNVVYGVVGVKFDDYDRHNAYLYAKAIDDQTRFISGQNLKQYLILYEAEIAKYFQ